MKKMTLSELLLAAFTGTERFYEGEFIPKDKLPAGCIEVPVPESLQPVVRLFGWISKELDDLHDAQRASTEPPTDEVEIRHTELHLFKKLLEAMISAEISLTEPPEGAGDGVYMVTSELYVWKPKTDDEIPEELRQLISDFFGGVVIIGRGGRSML